MDEELRPLLQQIADELRVRNELIREQREEAGRVRKEMFSNMPFGASSGEVEGSVTNLSSKLGEEHDRTMASIREDAEKERAVRREFQDALLEEIRRLNRNLEGLVESRSR